MLAARLPGSARRGRRDGGAYPGPAGL